MTSARRPGPDRWRAHPGRRHWVAGQRGRRVTGSAHRRGATCRPANPGVSGDSGNGEFNAPSPAKPAAGASVTSGIDLLGDRPVDAAGSPPPGSKRGTPEVPIGRLPKGCWPADGPKPGWPMPTPGWTDVSALPESPGTCGTSLARAGTSTRGACATAPGADGAGLGRRLNSRQVHRHRAEPRRTHRPTGSALPRRAASRAGRRQQAPRTGRSAGSPGQR